MGRNVEKIIVDRQEARLPQDLERYRRMALDLGADRAAIVKAEDIPVDERVVLKCRIPRCFGYGAGAHCPPTPCRPRNSGSYCRNTIGPCFSPWMCRRK